MKLTLGADFGLLVWGGEQGEEVVGRNEEEEGNWEIWGRQCRFHGWDTLGPWIWAGDNGPAWFFRRSVQRGREQRHYSHFTGGDAAFER